LLVLTRKVKQSIMIGDDVEVAVLSVAGDKVRLGITAPKAVPVFRREIYLEIQAERDGESAAGQSDSPEVPALAGDSDGATGAPAVVPEAAQPTGPELPDVATAPGVKPDAPVVSPAPEPPS
jgi:carbon storage regulator